MRKTTVFNIYYQGKHVSLEFSTINIHFSESAYSPVAAKRDCFYGLLALQFNLIIEQGVRRPALKKSE